MQGSSSRDVVEGNIARANYRSYLFLGNAAVLEQSAKSSVLVKHFSRGILDLGRRLCSYLLTSA